MGKHERHPIPQGDPDLWLKNAKRLADLVLAPPGATVTINAQHNYQDTTVERLSFFKSPAPDIASGEAGWFRVCDDEFPRPVALFGACMPGATYIAGGVIKATVGFRYAELAIFRSWEDAPPDLLRKKLPVPEQLDPDILDMCRHIGQVVQGIDEQLYWWIPTACYETGPVQSVQVDVEDTRGRFRGGDVAGS